MTRIQILNCADWNMRESERSDRLSRDYSLLPADRDYHARRAARLDMQAFRLFRQAHEFGIAQ